MKQPDDQRIAIARRWAASGMRQDEYAVAHKISPRTLRTWIRRFCPSHRADARALTIIDTAIAELAAFRQRLAASLEATTTVLPPGSAAGQQPITDSGAIGRQAVPTGAPRPAPLPCPPPSATYWQTGG